MSIFVNRRDPIFVVFNAFHTKILFLLYRCIKFELFVNILILNIF